MSLELYSAAFWIVAIISIFLQDRKAESGETKVASATTFLKFLPAMIAVIFVIIFRTPSLFTLLLAAALVFCMLGDIGMEIDLVPGIGMFLIAHILYTSNFLWYSSTMSPTMIPMLLGAGCMVLGVVFVLVFIRYLNAAGPQIPPFILRAGSLYFILICATLSTTLLLWQSSPAIFGYLPVLGALIFILSDSFIAVNEFRRKIPRHEFFIMPTYYVAIFLLSLSVFVYGF